MSDLENGPESGGRHERREHARYGLPAHSLRHLAAQLKTNAWPMRVRDVSTSGICLTADRRQEPGTVLIVDIHNTARDQTRTLSLRVLRVVQESEGKFLLSGAFTKKMTDDELENLIR